MMKANLTQEKKKLNKNQLNSRQALKRLERKYTFSVVEKEKLLKISHCVITGIAESSEGGFTEDGEFHSVHDTEALGSVRISYYCPKDRKQKFLILKKAKNLSNSNSDKVIRWRAKRIYRTLIETHLLYRRIAENCKKIYFKSIFSKFAHIHFQTAELLKNNYDLEEYRQFTESSLLEFKKFQLLGKSDFLNHCLNKEQKISASIETLVFLNVTPNEKKLFRDQIRNRNEYMIVTLKKLKEDTLI